MADPKQALLSVEGKDGQTVQISLPQEDQQNQLNQQRYVADSRPVIIHSEIIHGKLETD